MSDLDEPLSRRFHDAGETIEPTRSGEEVARSLVSRDVSHGRSRRERRHRRLVGAPPGPGERLLHGVFGPRKRTAGHGDGANEPLVLAASELLDSAGSLRRAVHDTERSP